MKREIALWKVLAGALAVLALSSGGAVALAADGGGIATEAPPDTRGSLAPNRSTTYVPLPPCRIFSTTPASIPGFGVEQSRNVRVVGNLAAQGGEATGCGIPAAASGIEASISATFNRGAGYLRAFPAGSPEPQATFLNYTAAGAATNTGAVTIATGGGNAFTIKNYRSATDVVVDVQGYYIRPMYALVNANGSLTDASRLQGVVRLSTGLYRLDFDVATNSCVRSVSVGRANTTEGAGVGFASSHVAADPPNQIVVSTFDVNGSFADRPFLIEVSC